MLRVLKRAGFDFSQLSFDSVVLLTRAGNMIQDGSGLTYTFDAENRLTLPSGMTGGPYCYVYDGNGLRVAKKSSASSCSSGTVAKIYWRSLSGNALAETDGSGSTTNSNYNEYVFFAGRRVGSRNGSGSIFYWFADQLGTTFSSSLKPRFAMSAQSAESFLYDYYNPEARASVPPAAFSIH